jgi:hypothetical protein
VFLCGINLLARHCMTKLTPPQSRNSALKAWDRQFPMSHLREPRAYFDDPRRLRSERRIIYREMNPPPKTLDQLLLATPRVIKELTTEFVRRGDRCMIENETSQTTACFLLALRSASLLCGMGLLMKPGTRDSWDVLARSFMEARDLLLTFRFDNQGIRNKIRLWFKGGADGAWKARHKECEQFVSRLGAGETELAKRWSAFSALSHPTVHAAKHSAALTVLWVTGRSHVEDFNEMMEPKIADYLVSVSTLIVATTFDFPRWVPLGCDMSRMPTIEEFRLAVAEVTNPVLARNKDIALPPNAYRSQ